MKGEDRADCTGKQQQVIDKMKSEVQLYNHHVQVQLYTEGMRLAEVNYVSIWSNRLTACEVNLSF